jgi:Flp pilus assembly protein TadD
MAGVSEAAGTPEAALARAVALLRQGDLEGAATLCRQLLHRAPRDPALHQLAAAIALQRGNAREAAGWAASSLALRPDHPPTLLLAGRAARAAGERRQALDFFRCAQQLAPARAEAAFLACIMLLELGDPQAQSLVATLLERFPDDVEGWQALGTALQQAGQAAAALVAFTRAARAAVAHAPEDAAAALRLGLCLRQGGDSAAALAALERAVTLAPSLADAWFALGLARQDARDFGGAVAAYRTALARRPDLAEAAVNLGISLQQSGDLAAAKAAYGEALRLRDDSFGRIAQALAAAPTGEVWLDLAALRRSLRR